jgi:hypothetical protein
LGDYQAGAPYLVVEMWAEKAGRSPSIAFHFRGIAAKVDLPCITGHATVNVAQRIVHTTSALYQGTA